MCFRCSRTKLSRRLLSFSRCGHQRVVHVLGLIEFVGSEATCLSCLRNGTTLLMTRGLSHSPSPFLALLREVPSRPGAPQCVSQSGQCEPWRLYGSHRADEAQSCPR